MPGAVIRNPTPDWLKPENASVLDSPVTKALRTLAHLIGADDPQSQVLGLMTPLAPEGQAMASKPVQKALKTLADLGERVGIKAYHGSPHDFDRFSLSKIGTGEGAQAYGHGLYFAESPGVAKYYKENLSPAEDRFKTAFSDTPQAWEEFRQAVADAVEARGGTRKSGYSWAGSLAHDMTQPGGSLPKSLLAWEAPAADSRLGEAMRGASAEAQQIERSRRAFVAAVKELAPEHVVARGGRMYEVNIKADPEQLLDWDKPLSQQNDAVRYLFADDAPEATGRDIYNGLMNDQRDVAIRQGRNADTTLPKSQAAASQWLREAGIPGIKYLDGGSRAAGTGTRNYVIFDDSLIDILKKYGVALPVIEGLRRKANAQGGQLRAEDVQAVF